jgi:hypothetical protein
VVPVLPVDEVVDERLCGAGEIHLHARVPLQQVDDPARVVGLGMIDDQVVDLLHR